MKTIVYVFAKSKADSRIVWTVFHLYTNNRSGVGVLSLKDIAKQVIDRIDEGRLKGNIDIIARPPDKFSLCGNSDKSCRALSEEEREKFRQYFSVTRVVG